MLAATPCGRRRVVKARTAFQIAMDDRSSDASTRRSGATRLVPRGLRLAVVLIRATTGYRRPLRSQTHPQAFGAPGGHFLESPAVISRGIVPRSFSRCQSLLGVISKKAGGAFSFGQTKGGRREAAKAPDSLAFCRQGILATDLLKARLRPRCHVLTKRLQLGFDSILSNPVDLLV